MKVSIGIPVYKAEKFIERCARSIFEQTYDDLEIVFVSDCSPDNSVAVIRRILVDYPDRQLQVKIIEHEQNQGVSVARNTALDNFTGELVSFVDADDYLTLNAVGMMVAKQEVTKADIVSASIIIKRANEQEVLKAFECHTSKDFMQYQLNNASQHRAVWGRLFRRSLLVKNNVRFLPGCKIGEDWLFLLTCILYADSVATMENAIYIYDVSNEQSALHNPTMQSNFVIEMCKADLFVYHEIGKLIVGDYMVYRKYVDIYSARRLEQGLLKAAERFRYNDFKELTVYWPNVRLIAKEEKLRISQLTIGGKPNYLLCVIYKLLYRIKWKLIRTFRKK